MEDSIERRALVLFATAGIVIVFGGVFGASTLSFGSGDKDWMVIVYIVSLVALVLSLSLSGLAIAPLREGILAWSRASILGWAILLFVVGVGLLALDAAVAAHSFSTGFDDYSG